MKMSAAVAVAALSLTSCGRSDFEGRWSGTYTAIADNQSQGGAGTMAIEVAPDGSLTGSLRNQTAGQTFSVVGRLDSSGGFEATFTTGTSTSRASWRAAVLAGHLSGYASAYIGELKVGSMSFDLSPL